LRKNVTTGGTEDLIATGVYNLETWEVSTMVLTAEVGPEAVYANRYKTGAG
jgi:hypothetical protein